MLIKPAEKAPCIKGILKPNGRNGAMTVQNKARVLGLNILFLLILGAVYILNFDVFLGQLSIWIRISLVASFMIGFAGCLLKRRSLSILGIVGSVFFLLLVMLTSIQWPEDYGYLGHEYPGDAAVLIRLICLLSVAISLLVSFILVMKWSRRSL